MQSTMNKKTDALSQPSAPLEDSSPRILRLESIAQAQVAHEPFTYLFAQNTLLSEMTTVLKQDFPVIDRPGFFPLSTLKYNGAFHALIKELQAPELAEVLSKKLGTDLRDKPRMITVRKWSAAKDGRIHNDGEAKIATSLFYLNDEWPNAEEGGRFCVLKSERSFNDTVAEVAPGFGGFAAFRRSDNSWHGHRPFVGERRVIQVTWLRSQEDLERKEKRGRTSLFLKRLLPFFGDSYTN